MLKSFSPEICFKRLTSAMINFNILQMAICISEETEPLRFYTFSILTSEFRPTRDP